MELNISGASSSKKKIIPKSKIENKSKNKEANVNPKKINRINKEIEIKKSKESKAQKSPIKSSWQMLTPESQKSQEESPLKEESSKGHHEIVSLLSNPNMLFNDASSIKYSIDNQNMSNFSLPSLAGEGGKARFDSLDGICYDLIWAFVGDKFPTFIFVNKKVCTTFLDFQLEINDEVLNALNERVEMSASYSLQSLSNAEVTSPRETMKKLKKKKAIFSLTDTCHEKFCESIQTDITPLMESLSNYSLKK